MMTTIEKIRIFGDSILKGVLYDKENDKYVAMENPPIEDLIKTYHLQIHNNSLFGCTVQKGENILHKAMDNGLSCDTAVLEYGGNDCDFDWAAIAEHPEKNHFPKTPLKKFTKTLEDMIVSLKKQKVNVILMTLPPIDAKRYFAHICRRGLEANSILSWLKGDIQTIERFQELYSLSINTIAAKTNTTLIDIRSAFLERRDCASLLCEDGIHPNYQGHLLIASTFSQHLQLQKAASWN